MTGVAAWVAAQMGHEVRDQALFARAFTHSSSGDEHYERLEFLGDRVLGLVMAAWLVETYPEEPEGKLSHRLNALVTGEVCAEIGRELGVSSQMRLGKQARDDGVFQSGNVLGDVVEALIGALYLEAGIDAANRFIRAKWGGRVASMATPPKHPKAMLQEWTAAKKLRPPAYRVIDAQGPDHARRFTVLVEVKGAGEATGNGLSKQDAEKEAAAAMLEKLN